VPKMRVLLADDHPVVRAGLRALVNAQPDMEVVGEAGDGQEAVALAGELRPDIAILDLSMPRLGGLAALRLLAETAPSTRALILTMHDDPAFLRQALAAGCAGYLVKKAADIELVAAIRAARRGETYVHSALTGALVEMAGERRGAKPGGAPPRLGGLSEREQEVLRLLVHGYTNQQAADRLCISVKTIETHRARLLEKLGLRTRAELTRFALENGLLGTADSTR
jgi:two-component system, NarL family, response regulator NreC